MAKRKSLAAQLYEAHLKKKLEREKAERQAQADFDREQKRLATAHQRILDKAARERKQEADRQERERIKQETQAKRAAERAQADQARRAAKVESGLRQREAARERERARLTVEQRRAEAEARTTALRRRVEEFENILLGRARGLRIRGRDVEAAFNSGGPDAAVDVLHAVLSTSPYPDGLNGGSKAALFPESRELLIEYELPRQDVIPAATEYRFIKTTDELRAVPRKDAEIKALYRRLVARVALRALAEVFDATPATLVTSVAFNGYVSAKDRATGKPIRPLLISVLATRDLVEDLVLDEPELDPVQCLGYLNAIVSPHPYDLEPVRPVKTFDLSRYKFVPEMDVIAGMDSRPDLLDLKPVEFEHLARRLFEAMGMKAWVTQASRDEGVDAVAVNEDPVVGGICVIQAKRYKNIVGLEAVHALAGAMADKSATKGILVATSWFGKASLDFAARNPRINLIDGRNLKSLLQEHLGIDALIGLPKVPPGWSREDLG